MYIDELEVSFEKNDFQISENVISQKIDFFHDIVQGILWSINVDQISTNVAFSKSREKIAYDDKSSKK